MFGSIWNHISFLDAIKDLEEVQEEEKKDMVIGLFEAIEGSFLENEVFIKKCIEANPVFSKHIRKWLEKRLKNS